MLKFTKSERQGGGMHVISRKPFSDAARAYPNDAAALDATYKVLRNGTFKSPDELRAVFPSLDNFRYRDKWWIINVGGNNLRLMAFIEFRDNRMYVKHIVTHAQYDKLCKRYAKEAGK
jgi:mRNA interferase HigB